MECFLIASEHLSVLLVPKRTIGNLFKLSYILYK